MSGTDWDSADAVGLRSYHRWIGRHRGPSAMAASGRRRRWDLRAGEAGARTPTFPRPLAQPLALCVAYKPTNNLNPPREPMKKSTRTNANDGHNSSRSSSAQSATRIGTASINRARRLSGRPRAPARAFRLGPLATLAAAGALAIASGCASTTLFQSNFNTNAVGAAPAHVQAVGTIDVAGASNSVLIVAPPAGATEHWTKISRAGKDAPVNTMLCNFSSVQGPGTYSLVAAAFIPTGSGLATIEFDTSPSGAPPNIGFMHLDFMQDGTVRMDDDATQIWGTYAHDQAFDVSVTLDITATTAVAHLSLLGGGASGTKDYNVPLGKFANQLGAVKIYMGSPWQGSFDITDIIVTKRTN